MGLCFMYKKFCSLEDFCCEPDDRALVPGLSNQHVLLIKFNLAEIAKVLLKFMIVKVSLCIVDCFSCHHIEKVLVLVAVPLSPSSHIFTYFITTIL